MCPAEDISVSDVIGTVGPLLSSPECGLCNMIYQLVGVSYELIYHSR